MNGPDDENCPESATMLHCFIDGELDSIHSVRFEQHLSTCPHCSAELERLKAVRRVIGQNGIKWQTPDEVRSRVLAAIALEDAKHRPSVPEGRLDGGWRRGLQLVKQWSFIPSLAVLAASMMLLVSNPRQDVAVQDEILASHIRSMLANHLVDIQTSDQHTVKPWFDGKIDFSPPVVDLSAQGFPLIGGRVDYIEGRVVAALIYRKGGHIINVFVWPGSPVAQSSTAHDGYNLMEWSGGGLVFWGVSDVNPTDLATFRQSFVQHAGL